MIHVHNDDDDHLAERVLLPCMTTESNCRLSSNKQQKEDDAEAETRCVFQIMKQFNAIKAVHLHGKVIKMLLTCYYYFVAPNSSCN